MSCWNEPNSKHAFNLSWVSTIITIIFATTGVVYYSISGSVMCLVFGLENVVDFLSSAIVLWRFWASGKMTRERERTLKRREVRASMAISLILMLLGMGIIASASYDITLGSDRNHDSDNLDMILGMAGTSFFVFGCLAIVKFQFANALSSESLYKDGVCSLIGSILAAAIFTNTLIIRQRPKIWWIDPIVAMVCGFAALFLGFHSIFVAWKVRRVPVTQLSWWMMSRAHAKTGAPSGSNNNDNAKEDDDDEAPAIPSEVELKEGITNHSKEIV